MWRAPETVRAFCVPGLRRMAWSKLSRHERGYDFRWTKLRLVILARDMYLCQTCDANGRPTTATAVDHILAKAKGGTDDEANLQAICHDCHNTKSLQEAVEAQAALRREGKPTIQDDGWVIHPKRWGYSIPHGLRPSISPVMLIVGPPASGKTTHIAQHAQPGDKIIDMDEIRSRIGGAKWDTDPAILAKALRYRDMMIRSLADDPCNRAWLIVTAITKQERGTWMEALGPKAELVEVVAPMDVIAARIAADPRRSKAAQAMIDVAARWER